MAVISIYSTDEAIRQELYRLLHGLASESQETLRLYCYDDFAAFLDSGRENPRRILLLAEKGAEGVELAVSAAEECPDNRLIWFSDLDFALFSYRLEVVYFGFLPVQEESLRIALRNCKRRRGDSPSPMEPVIKEERPTIFQRLLRKLSRIMNLDPL